MSARDVIANALCAVWSIADAERDADGILAALHAMPDADRIALARALVPQGWIVGRVPEKVPIKYMGIYPASHGIGWNDAVTALLASSEDTP